MASGSTMATTSTSGRAASVARCARVPQAPRPITATRNRAIRLFSSTPTLTPNTGSLDSQDVGIVAGQSSTVSSLAWPPCLRASGTRPGALRFSAALAAAAMVNAPRKRQIVSIGPNAMPQTLPQFFADCLRIQACYCARASVSELAVPSGRASYQDRLNPTRRSARKAAKMDKRTGGDRSSVVARPG